MTDPVVVPSQRVDQIAEPTNELHATEPWKCPRSACPAMLNAVALDPEAAQAAHDKLVAEHIASHGDEPDVPMRVSAADRALAERIEAEERRVAGL